MSKSLLDELREHVEGIENYWLALAIIMLFSLFASVLTLFGVYFYTRL